MRPLGDIPPVADVDGITIVPWPSHRSAEILAIKNTAFASHWGSTPTSAEAWQHRTEGFGARANWSFVAVDSGDNIVGLCLTQAALVVDNASPTGANRLYASLGFEQFKRTVTYQAQVPS